MIYLASPYSHESARVRHDRYFAAVDAVADMLKDGLFAYSPIVHCHVMASRHHFPHDFTFWRMYNEHMLCRSIILTVLTLPEWELSSGVAHEIDFANLLNIPITYKEPV